MAELISTNDSLNEGRKKLNKSIEQSERAENKAELVDTKVLEAQSSTVKKKTFETIGNRIEDIEKDTYKKIENVIENGDLSKGIDYWTINVGATLTVSNGELAVTPTARYGGVRNRFVPKNHHKYYISAMVKSASNQLRFLVGDSGSYNKLIGTSSGSGNYERIDNIVTADPGFISSTVGATFMEYKPSDWSTFYVQYLIAIDLTETFGVGNEPSVESVRDILKNYPNSHFNGAENLLSPISNTLNLITVSQKVENLQRQTSKLSGNIIVNFGDSIFGNYTYPTDISTYISNLTGATAINMGFGGTMMANHYDENYRSFSMCNLIDAVISGDFSEQEAKLNSGVPAYFADRIAALKLIDFNQVNYITLNHGTNDWGNVIADDNPSSPTAKSRYPTALRYVLTKIWENYPHIKVLLITPMYRFGLGADKSEDSDTFVQGNHLLTDFVEAMKVIGDEFKTPVLDAYNTLGINKYNRDYYFNSATDQTHPNQNGRQLIGSKAAGALLSQF